MRAETETLETEPEQSRAGSGENVPKQRRRRSRVLLALLAVCVLALVAGGVFGGLIWHQHSLETARQEALDEGNKSAVELLSYDHRDLDQAVNQRMNRLTGEFRNHYRAMVRDTVAPAAKAKQVVTTSSVVSSSVVEGSTDQVTLLLFINQSSASPALPQPLLTGSRVEMTLQKVDGSWLVSDLKPT